MSNEDIQENIIRILSNHYGFNYQEGYNIVSSHFFGENNKPLNAFQAFCHALTCLETFCHNHTKEIAEERWNELTINGHKHWENVGNYFQSALTFEAKLIEIQVRIANDIESNYCIVNNEQNANDIRCSLSKPIIFGLANFLIWTTNEEDNQELMPIHKYIPSNERLLTREETNAYYAKERALQQANALQEAACRASMGERASGRKAQKRTARQAQRMRERIEEAEKANHD